jgi:signal transduction histidine kinase
LEELENAIIEPESTPTPESLREKLQDMTRLSDSAIEAVRRISSELRPRLLDDLGLTAAIEWQAQQFQTRTGIACHCDHALEEFNLTRDQSTAIFRIFQDALTNVLRPPQAGIISVIMEEDSREFKLRISDNGTTEDDKSGQLSLGLLGMRERALLAGGTVDISRSSASGTTVIVRIPTSQPAAD